MNERLFALWYPWGIYASEINGQQESRRDLVAQAFGQTLEIGAGNGYNLPHYTDAVTELVVSDPNPFMHRHLRRGLAESPPPVGSWELVETGAEQLPYPDDSFDAVVGTYVLCTTPDPADVLREVARVLRPGGVYLFLEHVRASPGTAQGALQDALAAPYRLACAGCRPNRNTESTLRNSPLEVEELDQGSMPRAWFLVRPTIMGRARLAW